METKRRGKSSVRAAFTRFAAPIALLLLGASLFAADRGGWIAADGTVRGLFCAVPIAVFCRLLAERRGRAAGAYALGMAAALPVLLYGLLFDLSGDLHRWAHGSGFDSVMVYGAWGLLSASSLGALALLAGEDADGLPSLMRGMLWGTLLALPPFVTAFLLRYTAAEAALVSAAILCAVLPPLLSLPVPGTASFCRRFSITLRFVFLPLYATALPVLYGVIFLTGNSMSSRDLPLFLLLFGYLFFRLALDPKDGRFAAWVCRFGGLFLLPAVCGIVCDLLGLLIRFGCTPYRLIGLLLALLFLLPILGSAFGLKKRELLLVAALLLLGMTLPAQNPITVSALQQETALRIVLHETGMWQDGRLVPAAQPLSERQLARIQSGAAYFKEHIAFTAFERAVSSADWDALLNGGSSKP